jgi:hypothetical protein
VEDDFVHCAQCGQLLPATAPKFCPHCGAPVAVAASVQPQPPTLQVPPQPWTPPAAPSSRRWNDPANKPVWITVGLFVGAWLTWGDGPSPGALGALLWLAALVLIVLDTLMPPWWAQLPLPAWLRRPLLGGIAAGVFVLDTALASGLSVGFLFWAAATVVFLRDSFRRGELGPFDPRLLLRGWRLPVLIGLTLASLTFAAVWEPTYHVSGYTTTENRWDGVYRVTHPSHDYGGTSNAHEEGAATFPALLMLAVLTVCAYQGNHPVVRKAARYLPVIVAPILIAWAWKWGTPSNDDSTGMMYTFSGDGPGGFVLLAIPYYVGAVALALGREHWKRSA